MRKTQQEVADFMVAAGQTTNTAPIIPDEKKIALHLSLILEEFLETIEAAGFSLAALEDGSFQLQRTGAEFDMQGVYDGLVDLNYVNLGTANCCGLDMEAGHQEVHDSNMTKFIDGHRAESGKWIKGPSYRPADLGKLLPKNFRNNKVN